MFSDTHLKNITVIYILAIAYISPILIADSLYFDDIGRSIYGYFSWGIDGRPLADLIFKTIDLGEPATDISPFPQILCILIMATLCYILHIVINPETKYGWVVFTPIFLSPFFIQNIAFKFDSLTMAISIAFAAIPFMFVNKQKSYILISSCIGIFSSLAMYQASISAFTSICAIYILKSAKDKKDPIDYTVNAVIYGIGMISGYLIYTALIIPHFVTSEYANNYNQLIKMSEIDILIKNSELTFNIIKSYFTGYIKWFYAPVFIFSSIGLAFVFISVINTKICSLKKIIAATMCLLALFVIIISIPGPSILLRNMAIGPRVFIGFGFAISALFLLTSFVITKKTLLNTIYIIPIIAMYSYMATFASALKSQDRMIDYIINGVSNDIINVGYNNVKLITIDGKALYTPIASKVIQKFPLMESLIPSYFNNELGWGTTKMKEFYTGRDMPSITTQIKIRESICDMQLISDAGLYKTYYKDGNLLISFSFMKCD